MDEAQAKFTHATALIVHLWSALDIAVQNEWAGPESSNIRDWLGGVIVDMFSFPAQKKVDVDDVEEVLLQVMEDEFELRLEDDSAYQVLSHLLWLLILGCRRYHQVIRTMLKRRFSACGCIGTDISKPQETTLQRQSDSATSAS
jgi:hypothetical protein